MNFMWIISPLRKSQRKVRRKFPWILVPNRNLAHNIVRKVRTTGMLIDSKPKCQHRLLTEEKLE